jgi:hypothetical protein
MPKRKKIIIVSTCIAVTLLAAGSVSYAMLSPNTTLEDMVDSDFVAEKMITEDFDVSVKGDVGSHTILASGNFSIADKNDNEVEIFSSEPNQITTVKGKKFEAEEYSIFLKESPVLSDGSIYILPKLVKFELGGMPQDSSDATLAVTVNLKAVQVSEMTKDQLFYSAEKVREAGDIELADALLEMMQLAADSDNDDDPSKAGLVWHDAVYGQVKVVTKAAWTEYVTEGGTPVLYSWCCGIRYNTAITGGDRACVPPWDGQYDSMNRPVSPAHAWDGTEWVTEGGTTREIQHPEEFYYETRITRPAGWYPK